MVIEWAGVSATVEKTWSSQGAHHKFDRVGQTRARNGPELGPARSATFKMLLQTPAFRVAKMHLKTGLLFNDFQ